MNAEEFWAILHAMPEPPPVFFRLYYNEAGEPITYSMEHMPGTYVDVDPETYARAPMNVRIKNGQLIELKSAVRRLAPTDTGTPYVERKFGRGPYKTRQTRRGVR